MRQRAERLNALAIGYGHVEREMISGSFNGTSSDCEPCGTLDTKLVLVGPQITESIDRRVEYSGSYLDVTISSGQ